jgi:hypothetical protein
MARHVLEACLALVTVRMIQHSAKLEAILANTTGEAE